jgi:CubicO group peptidase (beta-lactamase class C family)
MNRLDAVAHAVRQETGVPGLVVATLDQGGITTAASGCANLSTGTPMTPDTAFLAGSVTKVWAATIAVLAVQRGQLALDDRLNDVLPEFPVGSDGDLRSRLLVRHLLNHSSGTDAGDLILETGRYPDGAVEYVRRLRDVPFLHAPGAYASYNNGGWVVLDLVLRACTGRDFHSSVRTDLMEPLGLTSTCLSAEEAILGPIAVGHFRGESGLDGGSRVNAHHDDSRPAPRCVSTLARDPWTARRHPSPFVPRADSA